MKTLILTLLTASMLWPFSASLRAQESIWFKDIQKLKEELPRQHKNLFFLQDKASFENKLNTIAQQADTLQNIEVALKIQQVLASMGDSHTAGTWHRFADKDAILPLGLYWFESGLYVLYTNPENEALLGGKIKAINNTPIEVVIDSLSTLLTVDNPAMLKQRIPQIFAYTEVMKFFGFDHNGAYRFEMEFPDGRMEKLDVTPGMLKEVRRCQSQSLPFSWKNSRYAFLDTYIPEDKLYYVQYNSCTSQSKVPNADTLISFEQFSKHVLKMLDEQQVDKFVFDMRYNSGGASAQGTAFIKELSKHKSINRKGHLFVLIGRSTYSSAVLNTLDFQHHTHANIVGEPTSGKPNHYGELKKLELPHSGLIIYYSTKYFRHSKKDYNTITPDEVIPFDFSDFVKGVDPVYEWVKLQ